jgi:hypothetical protein
VQAYIQRLPAVFAGAGAGAETAVQRIAGLQANVSSAGDPEQGAGDVEPGFAPWTIDLWLIFQLKRDDLLD